MPHLPALADTGMLVKRDSTKNRTGTYEHARLSNKYMMYMLKEGKKHELFMVIYNR